MLVSVTNLTSNQISLPGTLGVVAGGATVSADILQSQLEKMTELETLKTKGYITYTVADSAAVPDKLEVDTYGKAPVFISAVQTGTGAAQNVAHDLGVVPARVLVVPTLIDVTTAAADYSAAEGVHTSTNIVVTVTLNAQFKILAYA